MKRCPECRRDYYDDTLSFCLDDGAALLDGPATDEPATAILSEPGAVATGFRRDEMPSESPTAILPFNAARADAEPKEKFAVRNKRFLISGITVLLLVAGFFAYRYFTPNKQIESIAVMPFVNDSGNTDVEYLSDGMTETLIARLSQLPNMNVKPRSSVFRYKGRETNAQTVGKELNVQAILNGRVVQRGLELSLFIELIDVALDKVVSSQQYNRKQSDLVTLQSEIALDVSSKLKTKLSGTDESKITKTFTANPEAYKLYLKGRFYWLKFPAKEFEKSRDYYQQAIDVDPNFALAYAGLSEYYGFGAANGSLPPDENWPKSEAAANKALALDDTLPDAHNALGGVKQFNFDDAGAEKDLLHAIELNPNYVEGRSHYSFLLVQMGRLQESLAQSKKVVELEPLSVRYNRTLAVRFFQIRQYDPAIEQFQKALELDANDAFTHELLGNAFEQKGMQKEAVAEWSKALRLTEDIDLAVILEQAYASAGFNSAIRSLWQKKLERLDEKARRGEYVPAMNYVLAYTRLGDKEKAFSWLAKAEHERNGLIFDVKFDPIYNYLKDDLRFQALVKKIGFTE
jgi:TolB-like protein